MDKKILVVDDEAELCEMMQRVLAKRGYQVIATTDSKQALDLCKSELPDLIILDIMMPELKGDAVIELLKGDPKTRHIKIIVASGHGEMVYDSKQDKWCWMPNEPNVEDHNERVDDRWPSRAAEALGAQHYLKKPFMPVTLLSVVKDVLAKKSDEQQDDQ